MADTTEQSTHHLETKQCTLYYTNGWHHWAINTAPGNQTMHTLLHKWLTPCTERSTQHLETKQCTLYYTNGWHHALSDQHSTWKPNNAHFTKQMGHIQESGHAKRPPSQHVCIVLIYYSQFVVWIPTEVTLYFKEYNLVIKYGLPLKLELTGSADACPPKITVPWVYFNKLWALHQH